MFSMICASALAKRSAVSAPVVATTTPPGSNLPTGKACCPINSRGVTPFAAVMPLISLRTHPISIPRYLPAHELEAVVSAIYELEDPHQRAALLLVRWSGARRDEIRRLTIDCLDAYSDGHPRLRIPVGKGHAERMIPLHPDAADALKEVIEVAKAQNAIARRDSSSPRLTVRLRRFSQTSVWGSRALTNHCKPGARGCRVDVSRG